MSRKTGHYWVYQDSTWSIAWYGNFGKNSVWLLTGCEDTYEDKDFQIIDETPVTERYQ